MGRSPYKSKGDEQKGQLTLSGMFTKKKPATEDPPSQPQQKRQKIEDESPIIPLIFSSSSFSQNVKVSSIFLSKQEKLKIKEEEERIKNDLIKQHQENATQEREARIQEEILKNKKEHDEFIQFVGTTRTSAVSSFFSARTPSNPVRNSESKAIKCINLLDSPPSSNSSSSIFLKNNNQGTHELFNFPPLSNFFFSSNFESKIKEIQDKYPLKLSYSESKSHSEMIEFFYDYKLSSHFYKGITIPCINSFNLRSLWTLYACYLTNLFEKIKEETQVNKKINVKLSKLIEEKIEEVKTSSDLLPLASLRLYDQGNYPFCKEKLYQWLTDWISLRENSSQFSLNSSIAQLKNAYKKNKIIDSDDEFRDNYNLNSGTLLSNLVLITGVTSSGKTNLVHEVSKSLNLNVLEVNTSQVRSGAGLKKLISEAIHSRRVDIGTSSNNLSHSSSTSSSFSLILIDEVDIVFDEEDTCFHASLSKLAISSKCPIVLTAERMPILFESIEGSEKLVLHLQTPDEVSNSFISNFTNNFDKKLLPHVGSLSLSSNSDFRAINKTLELFPFTSSIDTVPSVPSFFDYLVNQNLDFALFDKILEKKNVKRKEMQNKVHHYYPPIVFNCKPKIILQSFPNIVSIIGRNFLQRKFNSTEIASIEVFLFPGKIPLDFTLISDEEIQVLIPTTISEGLFFLQIKIHHISVNINSAPHTKSFFSTNNQTGNFNSWLLVVNEDQPELSKILTSKLGKTFGQVSQKLWDESFIKGKIVYKERRKRRKFELLNQIPAGNFAQTNDQYNGNFYLSSFPSLLPPLPPIPYMLNENNLLSNFSRESTLSSPIPELELAKSLSFSQVNNLNVEPLYPSSYNRVNNFSSVQIELQNPLIKELGDEKEPSSITTSSSPIVLDFLPLSNFGNFLLNKEAQQSETEDEKETINYLTENKEIEPLPASSPQLFTKININILAKVDKDSLYHLLQRCEDQRSRETLNKTSLKVRPGVEANFVSVDPTKLSIKENFDDLNHIELLSKSLDQISEVDLFNTHFSRLDKGLIHTNYSHKVFASSSGLSSISYISYKSQEVFDTLSSLTSTNIKKKLDIDLINEEKSSDIPSFLIHNYKKDVIALRINSLSSPLKQLPLVNSNLYKPRNYSLVLDYKPFFSSMARKAKLGNQDSTEESNNNALLNYGTPSVSNNNLILNSRRRSNGRALPTINDPFLSLKQIIPFPDVFYDNLINITNSLEISDEF